MHTTKTACRTPGGVWAVSSEAQDQSSTKICLKVYNGGSPKSSLASGSTMVMLRDMSVLTSTKIGSKNSIFIAGSAD